MSAPADNQSGERKASRDIDNIATMTTALLAPAVEPLLLGGRTFRSRLILGPGKYPALAPMQAALAAWGPEMVTVALRGVSFDARGKAALVEAIDQSRYLLLPNPAGCYSAEEAIRTARLGREL